MNRNIIVSWISLDFPFHAHVYYFFLAQKQEGACAVLMEGDGLS